MCAASRAEGRLRSGPTDTGYPVGYWAYIADPDGNNLEVSYGQDVGLTVERSQPKPRAESGLNPPRRRDCARPCARFPPE